MENYTNYALYSLKDSDKSVVRGKISIPFLGKTIVLSTHEITCLEGDGNYTYIHTRNGKRYLVSKTMKSLNEYLDDHFLRIHKSYLINTNCVAERIDEDRVIRMTCGTQVTISRRKIKEIACILDRHQESLRA